MMEAINFENFSDDEIITFVREIEKVRWGRLKKDKLKFNKQRYKELLEDTPSEFSSPFGTFRLKLDLCKTLLVSCKHLEQQMDLFMLFGGKEGTGKSLFVRQINYVLWWFMYELDMVDYPFNIDLVHFKSEELIEKRRKWSEDGLLHLISILDESKRDLGRDKYYEKDAQQFIDYMRECRQDEYGIMSILLPQITELLPAITLSRVTLIFELVVDTDPETGELIRGHWNCVTIPRGKRSWSSYHNRYLSYEFITQTLRDLLLNSNKKFKSLPKEILSYTGTFSNTDTLFYPDYAEKKKKSKWEKYSGKKKLTDPMLTLALYYCKKFYEGYKDLGGLDKELVPNLDVNRVTFLRDKKKLGIQKPEKLKESRSGVT